MENFEYFLFDWDGCLANTLDIWMDGYLEIFRSYGINPTEREIVGKVFGTWEGPKRFGVEDNEEFINRLMKTINPRLAKVKLHDQVEETLHKLKEKGKKIGVVTTSKRKLVESAIDHNQIGGLIDQLVAIEDVENAKPDPEPLQKTLNLLKGRKEEALIAGDSDSDILAGRNFGITTVLFYPEENKRFYKREEMEKQGADCLISNFSQIVQFS